MKQDLIERFIRYVKIDTQSDDASLTVPSTLKQLELSKLLLQELQELNIDSFLDEYGLVYGTLKGEKDSKTIGLIAHIDTALECKGGNFTPRVIENYDGKDIVLNDEVTIIMVSHDIANAVKYSNKILHINKNILFFGSTEDYTKTDIYKRISGEDMR